MGFMEFDFKKPSTSGRFIKQIHGDLLFVIVNNGLDIDLSRMKQNVRPPPCERRAQITVTQRGLVSITLSKPTNIRLSWKNYIYITNSYVWRWHSILHFIRQNTRRCEYISMKCQTSTHWHCRVLCRILFLRFVKHEIHLSNPFTFISLVFELLVLVVSTHCRR